MTREQIVQEAALLPDAERLARAIDLWALKDPAAATADQFHLTDEQRSELDRRIAADDADDSPAEPWDGLRAKLLRKEF